jgi:hypothetical protein
MEGTTAKLMEEKTDGLRIGGFLGKEVMLNH